MAPARKSRAGNLSSLPPPSSSASFIPAVSTVAVAQICLSAGYTSAEPSALWSLSAAAALYLQTLARSAASIANTKGRTQSNLLDLIRAIEDLSLPRGFAGASDPARPLLKSSVLEDLGSFARRAREIPFPKPTGRREAGPGLSSLPAASFAQAGREPPGPHVPRWLPCFPERWEGEEERRRERRRWEEGGVFEAEKETEEEAIGGARRGRNNGVLNKRVFQQVAKKEGVWVPCFNGGWEKVVERERVRFELGREISRRRTKRSSPNILLLKICEGIG